MLSNSPLLGQAVAALLLAGLLPGVLLIEWLFGKEPLTLLERVLYSIGASYSVMVVVMLFISYLPGPVSRWQTFMAFDLVLLLLWQLLYRERKRHVPRDEGSEDKFYAVNSEKIEASEGRVLASLPAENRKSKIENRKWIWLALLSLLLVGGFFRFTNLGYSEFQGDEARAVLRAAAVIQGYEEVLLIHKKGPTEILLPTVIYSLTGRLNEQMARLPFAIANLTALFALFLVGWRLFGPIAGWTAAILLALDGYFIGFARIAQYQSVVFLMSMLVVLLLHRLERLKSLLQAERPLALAAFFLATGLLSHYEAIFAFIPATYLLTRWLIPQLRSQNNAFLPIRPCIQKGKALLPALLISGIVLASFYLPFILHPNFSETYTYLAERRIGGSFPYNNLADFFIRTTLYSTTYYLLLLILLAMIALIVAYIRGLGRLIGGLLGGLALVILGMTAFNPEWLLFAETDFIFVPYALAFIIVWLMPTFSTNPSLYPEGQGTPRLSPAERMLWLWLGIPFLIAFFFTLKPRTHIYVFFMPWVLLTGMVVQWGMTWLQKQLGTLVAYSVGVLLSTLLISLFGTYAYWYFVHNQVEVLRTWEENHPAGFWTVYDEPDNHGIFGFPLANGWKVVGSLGQVGLLSGNYESKEQDSWVPDWYTRGQRRCRRDAQWYFQIDNLEPFSSEDRKAMVNYLGQGFEEWGRVEINSTPRMIIHHRSLVPKPPLGLIPLDEWEATFDQNAVPDFPLYPPTVAEPKIAHPLHLNLGNRFWLEGYDLSLASPLKPGDSFQLVLYWRAQEPMMDSYKIFNHVHSQQNGIQGQLDSYPLCNGSQTSEWEPGELQIDTYYIRLDPNAPPGTYGLYSGMYSEETGEANDTRTDERLMVIDETGNIVDSQVHLRDIQIKE